MSHINDFPFCMYNYDFHHYDATFVSSNTMFWFNHVVSHDAQTIFNTFFGALVFISPALIRSQQFWITSVTTIHNDPISTNNLLFHLQNKNLDIKDDPTSTFPIKPTDISSHNTRPNFPKKSRTVIFVCPSVFVSFFHKKIGFLSKEINDINDNLKTNFFQQWFVLKWVCRYGRDQLQLTYAPQSSFTHRFNSGTLFLLCDA